MTDFSHTILPHINKRVLRLGVAGNYGLKTADVRHAVERGVGFWVWSPRFKSITPVLQDVLPQARERHVVAVFGVGYTAGLVRKGVEGALRTLGVDQIDIFLLSWLGRGSRYSATCSNSAKIRLVGIGW